MIEQANFTYSPLGKAFQKQIKTIEDQGEKQIKAFQNQRQANGPLILKEKLNEITELNDKVDTGNLIYKYKGKTCDKTFNEFDNAIDLIKDGTTTIPDAKIDQAKFKSKLGEIKKRTDNKKL